MQASVRSIIRCTQLGVLDRLPVLRTTAKPIKKYNNLNFQTGKH